MKRCSGCNKSKRHCKGSIKSCECNCTKYTDNITQRAEPDRLSDPANDEFVQEIMEKFRNLE